MKKHFIDGVPRYFMPYSHDCFHNALASQLLYMGCNINIVLADYLSFMYDSENGYIGLNYPVKPSTTLELKEEELNTSMEFVYLPVPEYYSSKNKVQQTAKKEERISIKMYVDTDYEEAYARAKELIDSNKPVVAAIDLYHMPYHKYYKSGHALHYVVITGYDEDKRVFSLFDKNRITASDFDGEIGMDAVRTARSSEYKLTDGLRGEYTKALMNIWAEIEVGDNFKISEERIKNVLIESCKRMNGEKTVLGNKCGLGALELFTEELRAKKQEGLDDRNSYLFRTYYNENFKLISRGRKRFKEFISELGEWIPANIIEDTSEYLEQSAVHWDVCANLCIKLGITKSMSVLDNMTRQLQIVREVEQKITENLYRCSNT